MDLTLAGLMAEARLTVTNPRAGARRIIAMDLPLSARWLAFWLMAVLTAILTHLSLGLLPAADREMLAGMMESPLRSAVLQAGLLLATVWLVCRVGRMRGGKGSFADTLVLLTWLQFLMLSLQLVQLVLQVLVPPLAVPVNVAAFGLFLWLLTNFVAELHGFRSLISVLASLVLGVLLMGFALAVALQIIAGGTVA